MKFTCRQLFCHPSLPVMVRDYISEYKLFLISVLTTSSLDVYSTIVYMRTHGVEAELHVPIRIVSLWFGPILGPIFGKLCQLGPLFLLTFYFRKLSKPLFIVVSISYCFAAWFNLGGWAVFI